MPTICDSTQLAKPNLIARVQKRKQAGLTEPTETKQTSLKKGPSMVVGKEVAMGNGGEERLSKRFLKLNISRNEGAIENNQHFKSDVIDKARSKFATSAERGIEYLIKHGLLTDDHEEIAEFLHYFPFLDRIQIGEYLSGASPKNRQVLQDYVQMIPMENSKLEASLRRLLARFKLPGEAQQIDRIVEAFAHRYVECNPAVFPNTDAAYLLAFSMIMLNTDLHNPSNPQKMTKETFVKNCQGTEGGAAISVTALEEIYDGIRDNELTTEVEDVMEYTLSAPDLEGTLWKKSDRFHSWNRRWCVLVNGCLYYFSSRKDLHPRGVIPLENLHVSTGEKRGKYRFEITASPDFGGEDEVASGASSNSSSVMNVASMSAGGSESQQITSTTTVQSARSITDSIRAIFPVLLSPNQRMIPVIKSAKFVGGQMVEGRRERFVFQCDSREERDLWVSHIRRLVIHPPSIGVLSPLDNVSPFSLSHDSGVDNVLRAPLPPTSALHLPPTSTPTDTNNTSVLVTKFD